MKTAADCLKKATYWRQVTISQLQYRNWGKQDYDGLRTSDTKQNSSTEAYLLAKKTDLARPTVTNTFRYPTARVPRAPAPLPDIAGHLNIIEACSSQPLFGDAEGDEEIRLEEASVIQHYWEDEPQEEEQEELCDLNGGASGGPPARACWGCGRPGHLRAQCPLRRAARLGRAAAHDYGKGRQTGQRFSRSNGRGGGRGGGAGRGGPSQAKGF